MIIISQDKTRIINFESLIEIRITQEDIYYLRGEAINRIYEKLGKYDTEERAKEVLQEIIERHANWENMKVGQPSGICSPIYEMPTE